MINFVGKRDLFSGREGCRGDFFEIGSGAHLSAWCPARLTEAVAERLAPGRLLEVVPRPVASNPARKVGTTERAPLSLHCCGPPTLAAIRAAECTWHGGAPSSPVGHQFMTLQPCSVFLNSTLAAQRVVYGLSMDPQGTAATMREAYEGGRGTEERS